MIKRLQNSDPDVAKQIYIVFQESYQVEAALLGASDFPPLKRPLEDFVTSSTDFYGYIKEGSLAGVVEIESSPSLVDVNSLVVSPQYFRQGVGKALMWYVLESFDPDLFVVETGLENGPATALYKKLGFQEVSQWDTEFGIRKVKFQKARNLTP